MSPRRRVATFGWWLPGGAGAEGPDLSLEAPTGEAAPAIARVGERDDDPRPFLSARRTRHASGLEDEIDPDQRRVQIRAGVSSGRKFASGTRQTGTRFAAAIASTQMAVAHLHIPLRYYKIDHVREFGSKRSEFILIYGLGQEKSSTRPGFGSSG
jgi:hypothetical protein